MNMNALRLGASADILSRCWSQLAAQKRNGRYVNKAWGLKRFKIYTGHVEFPFGCINTGYLGAKG